MSNPTAPPWFSAADLVVPDTPIDLVVPNSPETLFNSFIPEIPIDVPSATPFDFPPAFPVDPPPAAPVKIYNENEKIMLAILLLGFFRSTLSMFLFLDPAFCLLIIGLEAVVVDGFGG